VLVKDLIKQLSDLPSETTIGIVLKNEYGDSFGESEIKITNRDNVSLDLGEDEDNTGYYIVNDFYD